MILDEFLTDNIHPTPKYKEYVKVFVEVDVPTIQPQLVESTQGSNRTPRAIRIPNPAEDIVQKKKRKKVDGETSSPRKSRKVTIKQVKPSTTPIAPPSNDKERDEITKATLLSLALYKTAKIAEEQENVVKVQEKILEEDVEKIVEGEDEESYASEFVDYVFLNDEEDSGTMLEPGSHKKNPEIVYNDDEEEEKKDDNDNDDDNYDHDDHALVGNKVTDKTIYEEVTATISLTPVTTSQDQRKSKSISIKTKALLGSIAKMGRRRGQLRKHMKQTFVTNTHFREKMKKMSDTLKNLVSKLTVARTNELIKGTVPRMINDVVKKDREISTSNVPELISREVVAHAPKITKELFKNHMKDTVLNVHPTSSTSTETTTTVDLKQQLYLKMKSDLQAQVVDPEM
ncbi:hypothetical protein Tco_0256731 [Tanacetum coccineum]